LVIGIGSGGGALASLIPAKLYGEVREIGGSVTLCHAPQIKDKRLLLVDDVVTTGVSLKSAKQQLEELGGKVIAVLVILDRTKDGIDLGVPFKALIRRYIPVYSPKACPLCKRGIPFTAK